MYTDKLICNEYATIKQVMECINQNAKGVAFIVDDSEKIIGIVTDGDIRRTLLEGYGLKDKIKDHCNRQFIYASSINEAHELFSKFDWKVRIIPVLNDRREIVDYVEAGEPHVSLAQPQLNGNEYRYLMDAFWSTWISSTGKYVTMFEEKFADYCGVKYGMATSNGTTALHLALVALGIGAGDEVVVPDITFAATVNAVFHAGAVPVIVDIEEDSWCIDPDKIRNAITPRTKAIIPVHLYGQPCDMDEICDIARENGLYVIEDCAEAHGAEWNGKRVGSFGDISCFSFFGNKVVTTGEGGMCVTNNEMLAQKIQILRDHGMNRKRKYYHDVVGFNYRMTNMQAAIGVGQLEHIDEILTWRNALEDAYADKLAQIPKVILQKKDLNQRKKIAWLVSILVPAECRDKIIKIFHENGIDTRAFFIPLSEMDIYKKYASDCNVSKRISRCGINLPTTAEITETSVEKIVDIIKEQIESI